MKTFSMDHSKFYKEFDPWRKANEKSLPADGVYVVFANSPIERCLNPDPKGILYIGRGNILSYHNRIGKLINSFNGEIGVHEAGTRFLKNPLFKERFPIPSLQVEVTLTDDAVQLEIECLQEYFFKFGDVPPLNRIAY